MKLETEGGGAGTGQPSAMPKTTESLAADTLVWAASVIGGPLVLAEWADVWFVVTWTIVHTVSYWLYVLRRRSGANSVVWRIWRMLSSVAIWSAVPLSAVVYGRFGDHELLALLLSAVFVGSRGIVHVGENRARWEVDGALVGAVASVCSLLAGTWYLGVSGVLLSAFYLLAEWTQIGLHEQAERDRHALEGAMARMTGLAHTDQLTGLGNRRAALEWLEARRGPGTVVLFDLDRFKAINDQHGHRAGDGVLATVAGEVQRRLGSEWTLFRLGGDEFIALAEGVPDLVGDEFSTVTANVAGFDSATISIPVDMSAGHAIVRLPVSIDAAMGALGPCLRAAKRVEGSVMRQAGAASLDHEITTEHVTEPIDARD